MDPKWLQWAKELQSLGQTGLTYSHDIYDIARYKRMQEIAHEIIATQTESELEPIRAFFEAEKGHATPKVDVRGVIFQDDKILLVKERADGGWTLPGGWADVGETGSTGVVREVWEESGYEVRTTRLLAVYDRTTQGHTPSPYYIYKLFYECEITGGSPTTSSETDGVDFFDEEHLPPLSLSRTLPKQLQLFFAMHRDPSLLVDFD